MNKKVQVLRAVAILAVVLIHTSPQGIFKIGLRPFINFSTGLFLFLSGYLTKIHIENKGEFYKKRIVRVLIPYLLWTCLYTAISGNFMAIFSNILTTNACYTLYYVSVYIQLMLITPFLEKIINSKYRWIGFVIQPLFILILIYGTNLIGKPLAYPWNAIFCVVWFSFYYIGLLLGNHVIQIKLSRTKLIVLYLISIGLQLTEGAIWYLADNATMAATQIKFTSMLSTILFLIIAYRYIESSKYAIPENKTESTPKLAFIKKCYDFLILIGDCSFGIFLSHPLLIIIAGKLPFYRYIPFPINSICILLVSLICVVIGRKVLGKTLGKYIGVY